MHQPRAIDGVLDFHMRQICRRLLLQGAEDFGRDFIAALPEEQKVDEAIFERRLAALDRLRRLTEARFPRARDFIRPGLDEVLSEFAN